MSKNYQEVIAGGVGVILLLATVAAASAYATREYTLENKWAPKHYAQSFPEKAMAQCGTGTPERIEISYSNNPFLLMNGTCQ